MKLLGIIFGVLTVVAMIWATLFFWGEGQRYQPYDHPLMKIEGPIEARVVSNLESAREYISKNPQSGLYLKLHMSEDGQFFTATAADLEFVGKLPETHPQAYKGNKVFYYSYEFIKQQSPNTVSFSQWLELKPKFWIFDLQDNALEIDKKFATWFEENNLSQNSIIRSDIDLVISSLKKEKPLWIYGSTLSDMNKFLTLASVGLEGLVNFQRDYYFSPLELHNRSMINEDVLAEVRKRYKKIALGPVHTDQDREKALQLKPDVIVIDDSALNQKSQ